ncbi:hypothetical protein [Bailinhaonella thermotolerans]|uniref:Uncharacterized protein n=1 Tax=Bailinhaonella thermotolerans TaxID=1070861 RepID=A0A3A4AP56_9ACTN|nr:hypothetical protein [Bailinhaonella thermotolerans]RJL21045.1 hypothetical protein D5H75_38170 [Bailinhaonella thermotolerans]
MVTTNVELASAAFGQSEKPQPPRLALMLDEHLAVDSHRSAVVGLASHLWWPDLTPPDGQVTATAAIDAIPQSVIDLLRARLGRQQRVLGAMFVISYGPAEFDPLESLLGDADGVLVVGASVCGHVLMINQPYREEDPAEVLSITLGDQDLGMPNALRRLARRFDTPAP